MSVDHKLETTCPYCGKLQPLQTRAANDDPAPPVAGDVGICFECGAVALFTAELALRKPTDRERLELSYDPEVQTAVQAWREMDAWRTKERWRSTKS